MSRNVIIIVADDTYLPHAKSLMVNCQRQGKWKGDLCLVTPEACDNVDIEKRGIHVLRVPEAEWDFMTKLWIFTPYFRKWKRALCLDCDILVQSDLQRLFDGLDDRLPAILCDREDNPIIMSWKHWDKSEGTGPDSHPELYEKMQARYPHVTEPGFNMGCIFFAPESIRSETRAELRAMHEEYKEANPTNADQLLVNLHLYDRLEEAGKDYCTFFGNDDPASRVASEGRGWRGDEVPVILHYTRWHAPWIVKQKLDPEMGGYRNHRLGRICHELYAENLAAFEGEFPAR